MSKETFRKRSRKVVPPSTENTFNVYVVVRHTRAGDKRIAVVDDRDAAMRQAENIADEAAANYGHGSASVFKAILTLAKEAEQP